LPSSSATPANPTRSTRHRPARARHMAGELFKRLASTWSMSLIAARVPR
jgi:hypothetical protein